MLKVLDLFSGIGGFSLGLERSGMRTIAFCENDPYCRSVLRRHWPNVPIHVDVRTLSLRRGFADVVCGGFPCQDISGAGKRVGIDGERSGLWSEFARLIGEIRPRYVIVENVRDLLIRGIDRVLGDLASLRYDAEWHCIPAAAVGADHWRDRVWIIAYPDCAKRIAFDEFGRQPCASEVGEDVASDDAYDRCDGLQGGGYAGTLGEDARAIGPRLGIALRAAPTFPGLDGAGSPVLGRGEDGIPHRVDRMYSLGNTVVPQIPEIIGRAIMQIEFLNNERRGFTEW